MKNPFENKAIKFATEEELNHLAELARGYGLVVAVCFYEDYIFFRKDIFSESTIYHNYNNNGKLPEITYSDFIASLESTEIDYMKEVCDMREDAVLRAVQNGYYVNLGGKHTPTFPNINDAWKSAYLMSPPTPNLTEQAPDMVNHPKHYNVEGYEVIDIIEAFGLNFAMGSALKYLLRAERKGNKVEDLKKAIWCIQREIDNCEKETK
jgi:hypothetical protein